jgi:threonine/homoserine/homoserine lactone efflux protein
MCAAALGLSVIATRSALAFTVIKLAGALYLIYLGVRVLLDARREGREAGRSPLARQPGATSGRPPTPKRRTRRRDSFVQGFLTNVLNPKAALFFLSVLPQFVDHGGSLTRQIFLLGVLDIVIGIVYWLFLVGVAARLRTVFGPALRRRWEHISGWLFIAIGIGVAATE